MKLIIAMILASTIGQSAIALCVNDYSIREAKLNELNQAGYFCKQEPTAIPPGPFEGIITEVYHCLSTVNGPSLDLLVETDMIYRPGLLGPCSTDKSVKTVPVN